MATKRLISLIMIAVLIFAIFVQAEGITLPDIELPNIDIITNITLPNPGTYFGSEGTLSNENYESNGHTWDVWLYDRGRDWNTAITSWLQACESRGFIWTPTTTNEKSASYTVSTNGLSAVLVPEYKADSGYAMVMIQKGLSMDDYEQFTLEPLTLGQVRVIWNDHVTTYTVTNYNPPTNINVPFMSHFKYYPYSDNYSYSLYTTTELGSISFDIPFLCATGDVISSAEGNYRNEYKLSSTKNLKSTNYFLLTDKSYYSDKIKSENDYFKITIIYRDEKRIWCIMEGVYMNGEEALSVEFYLELKD